MDFENVLSLAISRRNHGDIYVICAGGCRHDMVSSSLLGVGCGCLWFAVGYCFLFMCSRVKNLSSVGWVCVAGFGGLLCGMVHGAGKAMLMRGGACAAELHLMEVGVGSGCVGDSLTCW